METASLFIQKVGVVLSGKVSHVTMSDEEKLHIGMIKNSYDTFKHMKKCM